MARVLRGNPILQKPFLRDGNGEIDDGGSTFSFGHGAGQDGPYAAAISPRIGTGCHHMPGALGCENPNTRA